MPRKITDAHIGHACELIAAGMMLKNVAAYVGCHPDNLSKILRGRGITIKRPGSPGRVRTDIPEAAVVAEYRDGTSELALSRKYGANRQTISGILSRVGIQRRGRSDANTIRMGRLNAADRMALLRNARDRRFCNMQDAAHSGCYNPSIGQGEREIAAALETRGLTVERQKRIDGYLVDMAVGNIAVEIKMKRRSGTTFVDKRSKQLIKRGWTIVVVMFPDVACLRKHLDKIVAVIETACRNPPPPGENWVIWSRRKRNGPDSYVYDLTGAKHTPDMPKFARKNYWRIT